MQDQPEQRVSGRLRAGLKLQCSNCGSQAVVIRIGDGAEVRCCGRI